MYAEKMINQISKYAIFIHYYTKINMGQSSRGL